MIKSVVKEVNIYRRRATVRREAKMSLVQGQNTVIVKALSASSNHDSVRLFLPDGVVQTDMQIVFAKDVEDVLPSEEKQKEIDRVQTRIDLMEELKALWKSNGNFETRGEVGSGAVIEYLTALPERLIRIEEEIREMKEQIEKLEKEKEDLEEIENLPLLRLSLESPAAQDIICYLEYVENSARWLSVYEVHTNADSDQMEILSKARIIQSSGEDWNDVSVNLFTGNPANTKEIPELNVTLVDFLPDQLVPRTHSRGKGLARSSAMECGAVDMDEEMFCDEEVAAPMMAAGAAFKSVNMNMMEAEESDADTMTCFKLPGTRSIPDGTVGTIAEIKTVSIVAEKRIIAVPKVDTTAYLAAMIPTASWPLKPSNAKIYLSGNYCGEVYIEPDMTEEIFALSLGPDERIGLSRETTLSKTEDVLLKGQKRRITEYELRISNNSAKPLDVIVWDQIPVSSEKQIQIDRVNTGEASLEEETGKLTWNLKVEPSETVSKRFGYALIWPKDKRTREISRSGGTGIRKCVSCGAYGTGRTCPGCGKPFDKAE